MGKYGRTETAARKTIEACVKRGIMADFMERRREEMVNIMLSLFDEETIMAGHDATVRRETTRVNLFEYVQDGGMAIDYAARKSNMTIAEFARQMEQSGYKVPENAYA